MNTPRRGDDLTLEQVAIAGAGAGIGALLGVGLYRGGYRLVYRKGLSALRRLLQAIAAEAGE